MMKNMLLVLAHPDDESFSAGLTVARYAKAGWTVNLLCATLGEAGHSGPYENISGDALGAIRRAEVEDAARILGIAGISFLGYRDGTLPEQQTGELEDKIYRKMVELSPQVVITHNTDGISNHPDHIKLCYSTTYAFQTYTSEVAETRQFVVDVNAGNPEVKKRHFASQHKFALKHKSFADVVESDAEAKLYYACMPVSVAGFLKKKKVIPELSFDKPMLGVADKFVTTVIDGQRYKLTKLKALAAHKSQSADVDRFYSDDANPLAVQEYFILRMQGDTEVFMGKNDRVADKL
jgi:LmbE family N-acetylglucosaminyl deacetylase